MTSIRKVEVKRVQERTTKVSEKDGIVSESMDTNAWLRSIPIIVEEKKNTVGIESETSVRVKDEEEEERLTTEQIVDLYDRHAFAIQRDVRVDYKTLSERYGTREELVRMILRHANKPNVMEKYIDGHPRLVAERDTERVETKSGS